MRSGLRRSTIWCPTEVGQRGVALRGPKLLAVRVGVDALRVEHLVDVVARLGKLDSEALLAPFVDVPRPRVIRGERDADVVVAVQQVPEVPRPVADVDLRVEQVGDDEAVSPGSRRDALRRIG